MKTPFTILALCCVLSALAQPTPPSNLQLEPLRDWLKQNWYDGDFSDQGYSDAREQMYGFIDNSGGQIECVYTGFQQAGGFITFPDPINTEHIVPQSFYGSASPMRSDIHNIRPCHGSANSARGNRPFGDVAGSTNYYGVDNGGNYFSTSSLPTNPDEFSKGTILEWEPREEYKGDVARQVFYFFTMYPTQAGSISVVGDINELYQWHLNDPVSSEEATRNNRIESVQGNRNPYIDYPDAVFNAWLFVAVPGCTDDSAVNYDPSATVDDGSCQFIIEGCTYEEADNFNPNATVDDGSCNFFTPLQGCTYPDAINFNPQAIQDDGSCIYDGGTPGCTYSEALNYSPSATVDDGSCFYGFEFTGCTYPDANNYDNTAAFDDGSCVFDCPDNICPADINGDQIVDVQDLLFLLAGFGNPCPAE
ncbi:MAG: endonuclease [Bacteroidota bacterium]